MYNRVLVPLDGSPLAEQALRPAIAIAKTSAARITLVHVEHPGPLGFAELGGAEEYMNRIANSVSDEMKESVDTEVIQPEDDYFITTGDTAQLIAEYAATQDIDLIVISTKGRGGIARAFSGSVADSLLRVASCPVLLVRPRAQLRISPGAHPIREVLVAVDQTPASEQVLDVVIELARMFEARMVLLHVIMPVAAYAVIQPGGGMYLPAEDDWAAYSDRADTYLEGLANRVRESGVAVTHNTLVSNDVAGVIVEAAQTLKPDLIALASRTPSPLLRAVIGSVADELIRHAPCPVLVLRQVHG